MEYEFEHFVVGVSWEEELAGVEFVHGAGGGPHVDGGVVGVADDDFGGAVEATDEVLDEGVFVDGKGGSEVAEFEAFGVFGDEDVIGFNISVNDLLFSEVRQGYKYLHGIGSYCVETQPLT